jgi:ketosteroid isomerase-like protein
MKRHLIFAGLLLAASSTAWAQGGAAGHGVPTPTRNVTVFTELENNWMNAVQKHDSAVIDKLVAPDYELRSGTAPGVPTAREEWLKESFALPPTAGTIGQMAVHDFGELMLVSFLWKTGAPAGSPIAQNVFVVDTWKRQGDGWQVVVRYATALDGKSAVPGAAAPSAQSLRKKI